MRSVRWIILSAALVMGSDAFAQAGFYLPTTAPSSGQDEFRAADGTTCRSTMDGTKRVEVGTFSSAVQNPAYGYSYGYPAPNYGRALQGNVGVYGRVSISLDATPERMDCNKLFELELEKRRLEVEILKRSLQAADRDLDDQKRALPRPSAERPDRPVDATRGRKLSAKGEGRDGGREKPNKEAQAPQRVRMAPL